MGQARQVLGGRGELCEDQARGLDAERRGLAQQVLLGLRVRGEQPQHAAGYVAQQPAPEREGVGPDLVGVVERAEDEGVLGQPAGSAAGGRAHLAHPIVGLVAVGQPGGRLAELVGALRRQHDRIDDHIVDEGRAAGAGEPEPGDLYRRRTHRHDRGAGVQRVALEVDEHLDLVVADALCGLLLAQAGDVDEGVARRLEPAAHRRAVVRSVRIQPHLDALAVVQLERLHQQQRGGMGMKVVRQVAHPDASGARGRARRGRGQRCDRAVAQARMLGEGAALRRAVGTKGQEHEGVDVERLGLGEPPGQRRHVLIEAAPVAAVQRMVDDAHQARRPARLERDCRAQRLDRLGVQPQPVEGVAQRDVGIEAVGPARQRRHQRTDRGDMAVAALERDAIVEPGLVARAGALGDKLGILEQFLVAVALHAGRHPHLAGQHELRVGGKRAVGRLDHAGEIAELASRLREVDPVDRLARGDPDGAGVCPLGLLPAAGLCMLDAGAPMALGLGPQPGGNGRTGHSNRFGHRQGTGTDSLPVRS